MILTKANLSQLLYLARYTDWRYEALKELDKRCGGLRNGQ